MSLSKTKQHKNPKNKTRPKTPEARFEAEWARVQRLQKRNQKLAKDISDLAERVLPAITAQERVFTQVLYDQTELLLGFFNKKSLSVWQRETLLDWINENLGLLMRHPFADQLDLSALIENAQSTLKAWIESQNQSPEDTEQDPPTAGQEFDPDQDDLFGGDASVDEDNADDKQGNAFFEQLYEDFFAEQEQARNQERAQSKALEQLLKGSSVNKLFRQVARVLHPDREMDEAKQKLRHSQMSDLIDARDRGDIPRLFALFSEHVGGSPLPMIEGDLDKVTQLLKAQAKQLENNKYEIFSDNPLHAMVYDRFYAKTEQGVKRNIDSHLKSLRQQISAETRIIQQVTSLKTLKPYLEARYEDTVLTMAFPGVGL